MKKMDEKNSLKGKRIHVVLKSGRIYSGVVDQEADGLIYITDKFGEFVMFSKSEISSMEILK